MNKELKNRLDKWMAKSYEWLYGEIETNICKGRMREYTGDLVSYMVETSYKLPDDKLTQLLGDDKLGWYLLTGAGMALRSSTSPFYRIYRHQKSWSRTEGIPGSNKNIFDGIWEEYDEDLLECFKQSWEEDLDWYHRALMDRYFYQEWTLQQMYEFYQIPKRHIVNDLNTGINIIRKKCQEC